MKRATWIPGMFVAALIILTMHNLVRLIANQRRLPCSVVLCERPHDMEELCKVSSHPSVSGRLAIFYFLSQRIGGAKLTIPPWMAEHRWHLERVSRLRVEISDAPMLVDPTRLAKPAEGTKVRRDWLRSGNKRMKRVWQEMTMVLEGRDTDYVLAETTDPTGRLYLIPSSRYLPAEVAAP